MAIITGNGGNNTLTGTAANDRISGLGGNDALNGLAGQDRLEGGDGRDNLRGGLGDDLLLAGTGNDTLYGDDGRDTLVGGLGRDIMFGGQGRDVFRFDDRDAGDATAGPLSDVIRDFSSGDVLDLIAVDAFRLDYYSGHEPPRGSIGIWQANGNTYVTWNTFNSFHDIELTGFTGDPFSQIRWYEDDYTATISTTGRIAAGQTRTGTIEVDQDQDWFRITLTEGQLYTFNLRGAPTGAGTLRDPSLTLYDADGNHVTSENVDTGTLDSRLLFAPQESGTYFISANGSGYTTGTYRLGVTAQPYTDYANFINTTGQIAVGQTLTSEIGVPNDEDWFRITLTEGETYTIDLRGQDSGTGTLPDPYLFLFDAEGNYIDESYDWDSRDARLIHTASASGTYYIGAVEQYGRVGTYELSVNAGAGSAGGGDADPLLMM